jgi:hypothetical protein
MVTLEVDVREDTADVIDEAADKNDDSTLEVAGTVEEAVTASVVDDNDVTGKAKEGIEIELAGCERRIDEAADD